MQTKPHHKFIIAGITLVSIMLVLYITFFYTIDHYKSQLTRQDESSVLSGLLSKLEGDILRTRLIEKRYQLEQESYLVIAFKHGIDQIIKTTSEIQSYKQSEELYNTLVSLTTAIAQYQFQFAGLDEQYKLIGNDHTHGLHGKLLDAANAIETILNSESAQIAPALNSSAKGSMMMLRRYEMEFIQQVSPNYINYFTQELDTFSAYIKRFDPETRARLIPLIDNYQASFLTLANLILSTQDQVSEIEKTMTAVPQLLQELRQEIIALESRRHALFESQMELINYNLMASAPLAIILTWLLITLYWGNVKANRTLVELNDKVIKEHELSMTTLRSIGDGIIITDAGGYITNINPVAEKIVAKSIALICGQPITEVIELQDQREHATIENPVMTCLQSKEIVVLDHQNIIIRREDGSSIPVQNSVAPILDNHGQLMGTIMVIRDATEQHDLLQKIEHHAYHDSLTGLLNRHALMQELEIAWNMCSNYNVEHSLIFIDLDRFKIVNDTCGHHAGDELLKSLTNLIRQQIRSSDILSNLSRDENGLGDAFARVGGDEFALFLHTCPLDIARRISQQIVENIREFVFVWDDQLFRVGASIGIATMSAGNSSINEVIRNADSACYEAKNLGRGKVCIHTTNHKQIDRRQKEMEWIPRLNQALAENHFVLRRQPIISISDSGDRHQYYEVLISLQGRGQDDFIAPNTFLPAAERYHLMADIDRWVITHAFREMSRHGDQGIYSINLSADSLGDIELLDYILAGINDHHLDPNRLIFEISGNATISNLQTCQNLINTLRTQGCRFALTDFGPSLSYFSYMKTLKVDFVKIDGTLVKNVAVDPMDYTIVESINHLAKNLGLYSIAEYVEDEACLNTIKRIGVDYAQGWAVGMPTVWSSYSNERQRSQR